MNRKRRSADGREVEHRIGLRTKKAITKSGKTKAAKDIVSKS